MDFESFVLALATDDLADATTTVARDRADAVEFRMDRYDAGNARTSTSSVDALAAYDGPLPVIATNRATWEGGDAGATDPPGEQDEPAVERDRERLEALATATADPAVEAVDVELAALRANAPGVDVVLEAAREHDVAVVASSHDFAGTPTRDAMVDALDAGLEHGDVSKLAVTATSHADALDLLAVTRTVAARGDPIATMAMGEPGRHTRAIAPVYGSRIGYAPLDPADATAPGQFDLATLADLLDALDAD